MRRERNTATLPSCSPARAQWWLLVEAKKRNPAIKTYGLPWCWPAFVGNGTGNPFFDGGATAAAYIAEWATAARDVYNVTVDYMGLWNEKAAPDSYVMALRAALDGAGLASTGIVAADQGGWWGSSNKTVSAAVYALGAHYPGSQSSAGAKASGKPLFASEDNSRSCLPGQVRAGSFDDGKGGIEVKLQSLLVARPMIHPLPPPRRTERRRVLGARHCRERCQWANVRLHLLVAHQLVVSRGEGREGANGQMPGSISWSLINSW